VEIGPYEATIHRTSFGVPHIVAPTTASLGYGTGYAFAQDHVCTLADQIVKVRSERSRYFGRGDGDSHFDSDVAWKALKVVHDAERLWFAQSNEIRAAIVGFAAGYNQYLADTGAANLPEPCQNAAWVKPISHIDMMAYFLHQGQMGSGFYLLDYIATAAPPGGSGARSRPASPPSIQEFAERLRPKNGSNGLALGGDRTETGRGMVVSNSHFEAEGERRWWELHQTVPGEVDVYGVALMGVPIVNMGFNADVAWTHTVSTTPRFTLYKLNLVPGDPTSYVIGDKVYPMETEEIEIEVLEPDGTVRPVRHTLYRSHLGPMLNAPLVGWTGQIAFTYRDVNAPNDQMIATWWAMNRAGSVAELAAAQQNHGIPWVHTIAADRAGDAFFADNAAAPNLPAQAESAYEAFLQRDFFARQFKDAGAYLFDAADPAFDWVDEGTAVPYAVPLDRAPHLTTRDHATNSNENHWLASATTPLEGYEMVYGAERVARQGRTKMGLRLVTGLDPDAGPGPDQKWSPSELSTAIHSYPAHHADVLLPELLRRCEVAGTVSILWGSNLEEVDLKPACDVLAGWDGSLRVDARGAHLFREWLGSGVFRPGGLGPFPILGDFDDQGKVYADRFDPASPLTTPAVVNGPPALSLDPMIEALARAVLRLRDANLALDARLGDVQYREKLGVRQPCPGGKELEGSLFIADWRTSNSTLLPREHTPAGPWLNPTTELTADGYPVSGGDSWIARIAFVDEGPQAEGVLIYGQSADPASPHALDQGALHGEGKFRPMWFREADVLADPARTTTQLQFP
jgi:acyl-homoserine-lactone acylase